MVELRLAQAGRSAALVGVAAEVLAAVIELLPGWKRVRDDRVRLQQVAELCPSAPHLRTVGRSLAKLAGLELIRYIPAQGRGTTATISVHESLLASVEELTRDPHGKVVVPFSRPLPYISQEEKHPKPLAETITKHREQTRPTEVFVNPQDTITVMQRMPTVFHRLPRHLRDRLRRAVNDRLARGWPPKHIVAVLEAPLPAGLNRPFKLAMWRLIQNLPGAGPRLAPLQRAWEHAQHLQQRREREEQLAEQFNRVQALTTVQQRDAMAAIMASLVGPAADTRTAVVTAARRATHQHPGLSASGAVQAWIDGGDRYMAPRTDPSPAPQNVAGTGVLDRNVGPAGPAGCVVCGQPGVLRLELPLESVVCDGCLTQAA
ncbi:MAG: hypothetical protein K0U84_17670 [Actinomycetia bacterium]|nr:hypothetical protein [Actinomycetes bacterium]